MKKTKTFKIALIAALIGSGVFASAKIIGSNYKTLRADFLVHSKGKTQHFINLFIN